MSAPPPWEYIHTQWPPVYMVFCHPPLIVPPLEGILLIARCLALRLLTIRMHNSLPYDSAGSVSVCIFTLANTYRTKVLHLLCHYSDLARHYDLLIWSFKCDLCLWLVLWWPTQRTSLLLQFSSKVFIWTAVQTTEVSTQLPGFFRLWNRLLVGNYLIQLKLTD